MRLKKRQKERLLEWIASGLSSDEINSLAAESESPFSVLRSQVAYYRKTRELDIRAISSVDEQNALRTGLAIRENRVAKLAQLAALMERDLFGGFLWTDQVKGVGAGTAATIVEYEEFNAAEVTQYRGVLDDIAREVGDRASRTEVSGPGGGAISVELFQRALDRAYEVKNDGDGGADD